MSTALKAGSVTFTVSGTDNQAVETGIPTGAAKRNARIRRLVLRQAAGGGATTCNIYFLHKNRSSVTIASEPRENVPIEIAGVPLTASATALSLDTTFTSEPVCQDSVNILFDVTAVGAWTLTGYYEYET